MKRGPITVRGVEYADEEAVASAFNISRKAVQNAINRGRVDYIGIPAHLTRIKTGADPMPVRIRGKNFPSAKAAAKHFKVSEVTVHNAIAAGREDFVGLGRSRKHSTGNKGRIARNAKPVQIGPYSWTSRRLCARAIGISVSALRDHLSVGDSVWLLARVMDLKARQDGHKGRIPETITEDERAARGAAMIAAWGRRRANEGARAAA